MSFPPRPPMGIPPLFGQFNPGMPPGMGMPPFNTGNPPPFFGGPMRHAPPPMMHQMHHNNHQNNSTISKPPMLDENKPMDHPNPYPQPSGPPVTVFVGNITDKWPDAMIRQLLATCGQVINWKRVQGASGKLQGFGFCEFNGPDAGLRAVRLLHDLEVGDKKLVVKVDAKTSNLLEEFKAERRKKKNEAGAPAVKNGASAEEKEVADYMDQEMKEFDERSKQRIDIIYREFKNEIDSYIPPGSDQAKSEKDAAGSKQHIQDKLHLLKLSSIDATLAGGGMLPEEPDLPEEIANDEGKREIITREISIFRESMKQEQEREEERKKLGRERREKEREREERKRQREKGTEDITSPDHLSSGRDIRREQSGGRDIGNRGQNRDNRRDRRDRNNHDRRDRSRDRRRRSRERQSKSRSVERILRSPGPISLGGSKPRYREREEEEEQVDQKRLERKAREKEAAYETRLREWEGREAQKSREYKKLRDRLKRQEEELAREAKKMKQFLEDYDDEKHDSRYYRGKDLQKRLGDRARELEDDNKDRQREREELEEMKLRMMTSSARATPTLNATITPNSLLEKYMKPPSTDNTSTPSTPTPLFPGLKMELKPSINSRLQAIANNQAASASSTSSANLSVTNHVIESKKETLAELSKPPVSIKQLSNPTTPISLLSPAQPLKSPASASKLNPITVNDNQSPKDIEEDSGHSFSPAPSPGMASVSPQNFSRDDDDSSMQSPLDAPKRKRMDVKDVFNQEEDDDGFGMGRKRKLVPLDFGDQQQDSNKKLKKEEKNPEEKKKNIKALIDKIPTEKDALFAYEIDWEMVDTTLMEKRIRPWINKKIVEYIGEPEPTLVDFICSKVLGRSAPRSILEDVVMVLDEEAEVFVVKMWRLLVYEIEAKKYGLAGGKSQ